MRKTIRRLNVKYTLHMLYDITLDLRRGCAQNTIHTALYSVLRRPCIPCQQGG